MKIRTMRFALTCLLALAFSACASGNVQTRTMTSEDYYKQAQEQMASKDYEDAKTSLDEARKHYRAAEVDAGLLALSGDARYQLEEYNEAIEVYGEFLKLHPRNPLAPRVQYQIGMCQLNLIKSPDRNPKPAFLAREAFVRVMENYPRSPEAQEAAKKLEIAKRALAESELFVGQFYFRKKNYRGAVSRFETILKEYPGTGTEEEALYGLGEAYRKLEDLGKAQEYFKRLLERYPSGKYAVEARDFLEERKG